MKCEGCVLKAMTLGSEVTSSVRGQLMIVSDVSHFSEHHCKCGCDLILFAAGMGWKLTSIVSHAHLYNLSVSFHASQYYY